MRRLRRPPNCHNTCLLVSATVPPQVPSQVPPADTKQVPRRTRYNKLSLSVNPHCDGNRINDTSGSRSTCFRQPSCSKSEKNLKIVQNVVSISTYKKKEEGKGTGQDETRRDDFRQSYQPHNPWWIPGRGRDAHKADPVTLCSMYCMGHGGSQKRCQETWLH